MIRGRLAYVTMDMVQQRPVVYRHSFATRLTHWGFFLAFMALVSSGLQIFNAAPFLDASDKTDVHHRVFAVESPRDGEGVTTIFGLRINTTGWLGWTPDGMGSMSARAFPSWLTIPAYQSLADGRRWHFFFAWLMVLCGLVYVVWGTARRDLAELILRLRDIPKIIPMQLYYLRLRKEAPVHGKYNPLQKAAYTLVLFILAPLIVLTGLALSPAFDAWVPWLTHVFGGRQFVRLWHFAAMVALLGFFATHLVLVSTTGVINHLRSMVTGYYRLGAHDGTGV